MARRATRLARVVRALLLVALALAAVSLVGIWWIGAWNLLFPSAEHDTVPPLLPENLGNPAMLVFSKTNGFRHRDGIEGGARELGQIAQEHNWGMFHTENGAVFNADDLARFRAVVFLNASGDMLNAAQEQAFQTWLEAGGGWLGIHAAGDGSHSEWRWYRDNLIGADFTAHIMGPQFQTATVVLENHSHPALNGLPDIWEHEEKWYSWARSPRAEGFLVLATLDEGTYTPVQKMWRSERDLSMGDHPVVWGNCVGLGRTIYAAMGHRAEAFSQPQVRQLLASSLAWLLSPPEAGCPAPASQAQITGESTAGTGPVPTGAAQSAAEE